MALCGEASNPQCYSWGWNSYGQLGLGDEQSRSIPTEVKRHDYRFTDVAGGRWHSAFKCQVIIPSASS